MRRHYRAQLTALALVGFVLVGCASGSPGAGPRPITASTTPGGVDDLRGSLTVFAAASLTEALNDVKTKLTARHRGLSLTYSFAGSQTLAQQIENGSPADVFASADTATMEKLLTAGLVDPPVNLARNKLEIAVAPGNPKHIGGLADLGRADVKVVLADPSVPAGRYARQALVKAGVTVHPVSEPLDVKSALVTVTSGEADAVVVYVTDVMSSAGQAQGVAVPDDHNVIATYPIAVLKASTHRAAARAFIQSMGSGEGRQALLGRGFLAP